MVHRGKESPPNQWRRRYQNRYDKTGVENDDLKEWRELNARWYQFGTFTPLYRAHGQFPLREIYNIAPEDHPAYQTILYYNQLRYRLMPYIYSLAGKTYFDDYTIMRPLVMDYASDLAVRDNSTQYMFGPSMMIAPVYTYKATSREVYFPKGTDWYDLYTGKRYTVLALGHQDLHRDVHPGLQLFGTGQADLYAVVRHPAAL